MRQQATALLDARRVLVEGVVEMAVDTKTQLEQRGLTLDDDMTAELINKIICVGIKTEN